MERKIGGTGRFTAAREIRTPEFLLKLIFLYLTERKSFGTASALLSMRRLYIHGCVTAWPDSKSPLVGLFDLGMKEMRLTDAKTGERLSNFGSFGKGGLIIADRAYGTLAGMEYLEECGSEYLLRYRSGAVNQYNEGQEWVEVTGW
ncbi:MAG: hypothetical protein LBE17_14245 [Treponema sp.]|nr:hypothetical protein [Treponema sp.]